MYCNEQLAVMLEPICVSTAIYSPPPRRRLSDDPPPRRYTGFSNERLSPERQFRPSRRGTKRNEDDFDVSYGGEPVPAHTASWEPQPAPESYDFLSTSPRTSSPTSGSYITEKNSSTIPSYVEGVENDGTKAEEVEEAGMSWTVTLPTNNEHMLYTHLSDSNSAWKTKKYHDKKIGTTTLESIYSIRYSTGEMGQGKITLFCPQGPTRDNDDSAPVQAKWLHVQRSSMSVKVLEKLVMDCPIINGDIRRVAILLLESVEKSFLRESENGAYIEPGSVLRFNGTRQVLHDAHNSVVTEPVIFSAFPFIELASSKNNSGSHERDDFYRRTLLQNLYGFDVVTSRGKNQVIHKMPVNCQPHDTLFVNQLWCLVIGSDILITLSDRPPDDLLGGTIEKRTDYFRQPLRIEIVDVKGFQHSMSISSKTPWVDFFRQVIYTVHGNLISIMDYELVDQADEVVTTERWAELAKAARPSLLKFHLVKRKAPTSRSSSVSSRRSSRSGIRRLLLLDYAQRDNRHSSRTSVSRYHTDTYDGDLSSRENISTSKRASTPRRLSIHGHPLMNEQQAPASSIEEQRETATSLEDNFFYISDDDENKTPKEGSPDVSMAKDAASSSKNVGTRQRDNELNEREEVSTSQPNTPVTMYRKAQVDDGSDSSDGDEMNKRSHNDLIGATSPDTSTELNLGDNMVLNGEHNSSQDNLPELRNLEKAQEIRFIFGNSTSFPRDVSYEGSRSRSSSLSNSTDESSHSRGRSLTRKRRAWRWESSSSAPDPSSRSGVRFQPQKRRLSDKDSAEMSPYGSSNATKVETRSVPKAVPFFFWRQNSMTSTFSSLDTQEQVLIKLLDQIDERISGDPVSRYYLKVAELTMDDLLSRQESLHESSLRMDSRLVQGKYSQMIRSGGQGIIDKPALDNAPGSTNTPLGQGANEQTYFGQTKALGLVSHDKALAKQLVEISQQIIWSFIPDTDGSVIHTLLKRLWGCVDIMCLQILWEENERERESECTYTIRDFSSQVKKTDLRRRELALAKTSYLDCGDCKTAKPYQSAIDALNHLHERHIECKHRDSDRPYDDPCYVWLRRTWHDGYPMRSSRDGLLGIMEEFIEELSFISDYVGELHNMTTRDSPTSDAVSTPPLSMNITHAFQQIIKMFVFRSKQLSLINRRRSLISGSSLENFPLIQRIDRKIEELFSLEMDANERIIDRLESAKKDIFLTGIGSHSEMLEAETVRVQFLALAFMSEIQRPLFQPSTMGRSYEKDTLLRLYKDYTSRLHFEANNRPRKRVFLDIHGLEEELQALDKLVDSQESCLYNFLTLIDPLTSRYTTETRFREFRVEVQFGNDQLHRRIERRREIDNLATRLWILKDQVKQTIEIMEEDHGKAIRVFTVVTLFFLPLSFVSSFLGMNTTDVRNSEWNQAIFWITAVPVTVGVLSLAFIYGYRGEEIRDWMIQALQARSRQGTASAFHEMGGRTSFEARQKERYPAITAEQNTIEKRGFSNLRHMNGTFKVSDGLDGRVSIRRRNTEDSLAPMRHE
ncbi:hypothetical protein TRIATDRAFT_88959 [Trichoderma atroviride IMI 206040]|uniref:Mg2+ transporter n=1 Tax=Hypocrea atroviridis (strain ATCC 20476 / IMI 206040) TaxID=452589 RepID=G9NUA5_HYPAI|nr:uncharacterized protein TRIATDRAFT_88959 [Trichoderma atroviride IMI 206040]EHK45638.1 hypothetical protein TRIATDRAFT_88959 [Trichoderma atroviride IMI 206040]